MQKKLILSSMLFLNLSIINGMEVDPVEVRTQMVVGKHFYINDFKSQEAVKDEIKNKLGLDLSNGDKVCSVYYPKNKNLSLPRFLPIKWFNDINNGSIVFECLSNGTKMKIVATFEILDFAFYLKEFPIELKAKL